MIKKKAFKNLEINSKDSGSFQKVCLFLVKYNMISFVVLLIYNKLKKKQSKIVKFNVKFMNWWIYSWKLFKLTMKGHSKIASFFKGN